MWTLVSTRTGNILEEYLSEREAYHAVDDWEPGDVKVVYLDEEEECSTTKTQTK